MAGFATLDDQRNSSASSAGYTQIDVAPSFRIAGFTGEWLSANQEVPVPGTLTLLIVALTGIGFAKRRRLNGALPSKLSESGTSTICGPQRCPHNFPDRPVRRLPARVW
jgi:hypothetical protein